MAFRVFYPSSVGCLPSNEATISKILKSNGTFCILCCGCGRVHVLFWVWYFLPVASCAGLAIAGYSTNLVGKWSACSLLHCYSHQCSVFACLFLGIWAIIQRCRTYFCFLFVVCFVELAFPFLMTLHCVLLFVIGVCCRCLPTEQGFDSFFGLPYSHEEGQPTTTMNNNTKHNYNNKNRRSECILSCFV